MYYASCPIDYLQRKDRERGLYCTMDKQQTTKIKGVAILLLLFHHLFYSASRMEENQMVFHLVSETFVQNIALCARVCVWIFAFLSAFGLSRKYRMLSSSHDGQSVNQFIKAHWISLMKPYWFVFVLIFLRPLCFFKIHWMFISGIRYTFSWAFLVLLISLVLPLCAVFGGTCALHR